MGPRVTRVTVTALAIGVAVLLAGMMGTGGAEPGRIVFLAGAGSDRVLAQLDVRTMEDSVLDPAHVPSTGPAWLEDGSGYVVACDVASLETADDLNLNHGVCLADAGGERTLLFDAGVPVQHPVTSPDGSRVVFASGAEADHGLKIVGDGSGVRSLCDGFCPLFRFFDLAWSPDGSRVAFVATTPGSAGHLPQIYVVTVGESDYTQLTDTGGNEFHPAWSPDGSRIAFTSRSGDTEIYVMDADGADQVRLTDRKGLDVDPSWSPDASRIVYASLEERSWSLWLVGSDGGPSLPVETGRGPASAPHWFGDG